MSKISLMHFNKLTTDAHESMLKTVKILEVN